MTLTSRINKRIADGPIVLTQGRSGKIKIYSLEGYQSSSNSAKINKPWLKSSAIVKRNFISRLLDRIYVERAEASNGI